MVVEIVMWIAAVGCGAILRSAIPRRDVAQAGGAVGAANAMAGGLQGIGNAGYLASLMKPGGGVATPSLNAFGGQSSGGFGTGAGFGNQDIGGFL